MLRSQYDSDVTVWNPLGRLLQVEYAMEAVTQGAPAVAVKNNSHVVLAAIKRAPSDLSYHHKKIIVIGDHVGVSLSGLTADSRILGRFLRNENLAHEFMYGTPLSIDRLLTKLTSKMQRATQTYTGRPYGVGFLVGGYDSKGPHIYHVCPSSNAVSCTAMAIGTRSQSARSYLEKHQVEFDSASLEEIVKHSLRALRNTLPIEIDLTEKTVTVGIVGEGTPFKECNETEISEYLGGILGEERREAVPSGSGANSESQGRGASVDSDTTGKSRTSK